MIGPRGGPLWEKKRGRKVKGLAAGSSLGSGEAKNRRNIGNFPVELVVVLSGKGGPCRVPSLSISA